MSKRISTAKTEARRKRYPRVGSHQELVRRARALAACPAPARAAYR